MWRVLFAGFLIAHALIHASFLAPAPATAAGGPPWPFHLDRSWLLTRLKVPTGAMLRAGRVLVTFTILGFVVAALGLLVDTSWWPPVAVTAAAVSLVLLTVWFHWWLPVGVAIDTVRLRPMSNMGHRLVACDVGAGCPWLARRGGAMPTIEEAASEFLASRRIAVTGAPGTRTPHEQFGVPAAARTRLPGHRWHPNAETVEGDPS